MRSCSAWAVARARACPTLPLGPLLTTPHTAARAAPRWLRQNRHMRYMWLPYTDTVVVVQVGPASAGECGPVSHPHATLASLHAPQSPLFLCSRSPGRTLVRTSLPARASGAQDGRRRSSSVSQHRRALKLPCSGPRRAPQVNPTPSARAADQAAAEEAAAAAAGAAGEAVRAEPLRALLASAVGAEQAKAAEGGCRRPRARLSRAAIAGPLPQPAPLFAWRLNATVHWRVPHVAAPLASRLVSQQA